MVKMWQKIKEVPYQLAYRKVVKRTFRLPDGIFHDYDIILNRPVAAAVALTSDHQVIVCRQFRPGPEKVLLELPAGVVDEGETPAQTMGRELLEETGYTGELDYVGPQYRDAYATIVLHTFVAKNCQKIAEPKNETDEFIEVVLLSVPEFRAHIRTGQLTDVGPAYTALDYLNLL